MSVDHLQINVTDATYNNETWLYQVLSGTHNDTIDALADFSTALNGVNGLTKKGTRISSNDTSGTDNMQWEVQDPLYVNTSYLSSSNATILRNAIITQLATITNLQSYKDVAVRSYRNDLQKSDFYVYEPAGTDGLEIFISNMLYKSVSYVEPSDIDTFLSDVNDALDTINGLEFAGVVISSTKSSTDGIFIGVVDASYNGEKYIMNASTLYNEILYAIETVANTEGSDPNIEIKIARKDNQPST